MMRRHRRILQDSLCLVFFMAVATLIAYEYDIFPNAPGVPIQERLIETDEALALATLLCIGLLGLSWRFLLTQRREVARRIAAEGRARKIAMQDSLTGLANRRKFGQEIQAALAAPPGSDFSHAVFLLDLNSFKHVNDIYGHGIGDEVLINVALRLRRAVRDDDIVARFGGDEFAILARQLAGSEDATTIAMRVIRELDHPIVTGSIQHKVGVSIGISLVPQDGKDDSEVLRKADIALYRAKERKPESFSCFFDAEMDVRIRERDLIERDLPSAVHSGAVQPYYQPLVDLHTGQIVGFEALARWIHPTLGQLSPDRFLPIADSCGLIRELTDHLLRQATCIACRWPAGTILSFNVSPSLLKDQTLGLRILSILAASGLPPARLEIELAESALVRDIIGVQDLLGALQSAGVRIALDDFGTGYSNLYQLRNFKIDKIKIDRSFVGKMEHDPEAFKLVRGLLGFGHGLGLTVTAEGVEQPAQAAALLAHGCQQAQGYLYSAAMSAAETMDFIDRPKREPAASLMHVAS